MLERTCADEEHGGVDDIGAVLDWSSLRRATDLQQHPSIRAVTIAGDSVLTAR